MPAKYVCPAAERKNIYPFLICKLMKEEGVDYNLRENAQKISCVNQHYCPCTKRNENTSKSKDCYEFHTSLNGDM